MWILFPRETENYYVFLNKTVSLIKHMIMFVSAEIRINAYCFSSRLNRNWEIFSIWHSPSTTVRITSLKLAKMVVVDEPNFSALKNWLNFLKPLLTFAPVSEEN